MKNQKMIRAVLGFTVFAVSFLFTACQKDQQSTPVTSEQNGNGPAMKTTKRSFDDLLAAQQTFSGVQWFAPGTNIFGVNVRVLCNWSQTSSGNPRVLK